jgi:hypothetical protein
MARDEYLFTSESVTEGHPDKIADQISDAVLDAIIGQDPTGRVACETLLTTGLVVVAGEITTNCYVDIPRVARETIKQVGYTRAKYGFDYETCGVIAAIDEQSSDIAMGVDNLGAGDQGLMFGYACTETPELMPLPITLAHKLVMRLSERRKSGGLDYLRPDGKSQVTVKYVDGKPVSVATVVISTQHSPDVSSDQIRQDVIEQVIVPTIPAELIDATKCIFHINPTGRFVTGGPMGDTAQDHRRYVWRLVPPRWRRVLGQGPDEGGPLGLLHGPVRRQEPRRRRSGRARAGAGGLRHRGGRSRLDHGRHVRYRQGAEHAAGGARAAALRLHAGRDHQAPQPAAADLPEDRRLRTLRPVGARVHVGADRSGERSQGRYLARFGGDLDGPLRCLPPKASIAVAKPPLGAAISKR